MVESAKSLGLPVCVKPFLSDQQRFADDSNYNAQYALKDFSKLFCKSDEIGEHEYGTNQAYLKLFGKAVCRYNEQDITWCQKLSCHQPTAAAVKYGNKATLKVWYKSAALLIRIPNWSNYYRQKLTKISTGECCMPKAGTTDEDGIVKDFKGIIHDCKDIMQEETKQMLDEVCCVRVNAVRYSCYFSWRSNFC